MKTFFWTIIAVFLLAVLGGIYFIFSGCYDVAASSEDPAIMRWVLQTTREQSIERRVGEIVPPADSVLNDPETIRSGFEHYDEMCVVCHGAPGVDAGEAREGLNPEPPLLVDQDEDLSPREAFWVVKYGIKMTGMPAWGPTHSDDKIWAIVAFVKKLPELNAADYRAMRQQLGETGAEPHEHHE
jgi:mono/diheme cytochrome c family protein